MTFHLDGPRAAYYDVVVGFDGHVIRSQLCSSRRLPARTDLVVITFRRCAGRLAGERRMRGLIKAQKWRPVLTHMRRLRVSTSASRVLTS